MVVASLTYLFLAKIKPTRSLLSFIKIDMHVLMAMVCVCYSVWVSNEYANKQCIMKLPDVIRRSSTVCYVYKLYFT